MRKIKLQKIVGNLMDKLRKLRKWNGHLEILRQCLLLRTDISRKRVFGCPCMVPEVSISARELIVITNWSKSNAELFIQSILYTRHFHITCITKKKKNNEPEETSPRGLSGRRKRQNLKFLSECYP